jgi:hypothetical protein
MSDSLPCESAGTEELFGVGVFSGHAPSNLQVKILHEFDSQTYTRYSRAVNSSLRPLNDFNIALVEKNFVSYLNVQKFTGRLMTLGREFGTPDRAKLAESVMGQIVNWLTSFRLFLDHAETGLKRLYGKDSPQMKRFENQTSLAFDSARGYRFVSKFRNYVQHCGAPLSMITVGRRADSAGDSVRVVTFSLHRDRLLLDGDWGATVRTDLENMDETFELEPLAREAMEQIREISQLLLDISLEEGARTISDVREALSFIPSDEEGVPNLFRFTVGEDSQIRTFSPQPFPSEDTVIGYESLLAGSKKPSDLRTRRAPSAPPPYDPATIAQRFHQDNRAVQLMALWQMKGGSTDFLADHVNAMIREDGGVDSILAGFFNMTAVLVYMAAGAMGIDSEALIGGLLDVYPEPDLDGSS